MKYYYLNCEPQKRPIIKRKLKSYMEEPYIILDRLEDCTDMLMIGHPTPDMTHMEELARRMNLQITTFESIKQLEQQTTKRVRDRNYSLEY